MSIVSSCITNRPPRSLACGSINNKFILPKTDEINGACKLANWKLRVLTKLPVG
jgi:hypothetical protein